MKVSLKEARRTERRIQENELSNAISLTSDISIYTDDSVITEIANAKDKTELNIFNKIGLINARATIRRSIQETNESSGINALIAKREEYIRILSVWEDVKNASENVKPDAIIMRDIEAKSARSAAGKDDYYSSRQNAVEFTAISDEVIKLAVERVRDTQLKIDKCDDELAGLNATVKVELNPTIIGLLKENNII